MRRLISGMLSLSVCAACGAGVVHSLVTPDNANLRVVSVDPATGTLTPFASKPAGRWIELADAIDSWTIGNLRHAMQVGSELWITDQISNAIYRYSVQAETPRFLGTLTGVQNPRGMAVVNGEVWIASGSVGAGGGIVRLDTSGNSLGWFAAEDPFAVLPIDTGSVLTSNIQQNRLDRYASSGAIGTFNGVWSGQSQIDFPMQLGRWNESGQDRIVAVGFSGLEPGLYVYAASSGAFVKRVLTIIILPDVTLMNPRGFAPMQNSEILWTGSQGIFALNTSTGLSRVVYTGENFSCGFVAPVDFSKYCAGDLNNDGLVDDSDFSIFVVAYNALLCPLLESGYPAGCTADLNGDGLVDDLDFSIFVGGYDALVCP
ncbi:MAG: hypothetical protein JNM86_15365 [Phycisphaerae bacterium]|nr:hypothetical protein [Phycisphaerae bacterium]